MTPPIVGLGTVRRLSELAGPGRPVLSVYLGVHANGCSPACARDDELDALLGCLRPRAADGDVERVRAMMRSLCAPSPGTRGLALFSTAEGSEHAAVALPAAVEPMAVWDAVPWLEPLAGIFTSGDWGLGIVGWASARLLRGGPGGLVEFATLRDELHCSHVDGDCSKLDPRHVSEEHVAEHVQLVAQLLARAHRRRAFERLALAAPYELWGEIERELDLDLRERLAGLVPADPQCVPASAIARTLVEVIQEAGCAELSQSASCTVTGPWAAAPASVCTTGTRQLARLSAAPHSAVGGR